MGKSFQFRSIGARLTFWFFIIAMFPLIAAGITIYHHMVNTMEESIFNKLEAIRDLKASVSDMVPDGIVYVPSSFPHSGVSVLTGHASKGKITMDAVRVEAT